MKLLLFIIKFFVIGALFIVSTQNLALAEPGNFQIFTEQYTNWVSNLFDNGVSLVGDAVKLEWLPGEITDLTIEG